MTSNTVHRYLLGAGVLITPVFFAVAAVLALISEGFDLRKQALSALSLGPYGWIQQSNFVLCGVLALLCAIGFWRTLEKRPLDRLGSILVLLVGLGLLLAGLFSTDPAFGFPKGAPEGFPSQLSQGALIHSLAFYTAFTALSVASFVFSGLFSPRKMRGWAAYSLGSGLATPILIGLGVTALSETAGIVFAVAGLVSLGWLSLCAKKFLEGTTNRRS